MRYCEIERKIRKGVKGHRFITQYFKLTLVTDVLVNNHSSMAIVNKDETNNASPGNTPIPIYGKLTVYCIQYIYIAVLSFSLK